MHNYKFHIYDIYYSATQFGKFRYNIEYSKQ